MAYSNWIPQGLVPPWMRAAWWAKYWQGIGLVFDLLVTTVKWAVKARFPSTAYAASDSLNQIGGDRLLPRASSGAGAESDASFAARLFNAWGIWLWSGTAYGTLTALATAGYPTAILMTVGGTQYTLSGGVLVTTSLPEVAGLIGTWMSRATRSYWSEFQVVFAQPNLPSTTQGAVSTWSGGLPAANSAEIQMLVALIQRWKPGFARCAGIVAVTAKRCWGYPTGLTFGGLAGAGYAYGTNATTLFTVD
jgi:hypothetical protein